MLCHNSQIIQPSDTEKVSNVISKHYAKLQSSSSCRENGDRQTLMEKYNTEEMMKLHLPSIQKKIANAKTFFIFLNGEVEAISKKYQSKLYNLPAEVP